MCFCSLHCRWRLPVADDPAVAILFRSENESHTPPFCDVQSKAAVCQTTRDAPLPVLIEAVYFGLLTSEPLEYHAGAVFEVTRHLQNLKYE